MPLWVILAAAAVLTQGPAPRTPQWLFEHGHFGEARAVAAARVSAAPRDAEALAWLARTYTLTGDIATAIDYAERAIASDPRYAGGHLSLAEALGVEARRINILRQLPMARRIKRKLETAVQLAPANIEALDGLMQFYLLAPRIAGGSDAKADETAARIAAIDAARGFIAQGDIAAHRKKPALVEGFLVKAVDANPSSRHARIALANFYAAKPDRLAAAEAQAKALLEIDDALMTPYRVLAVVYGRAGRLAELDDILARADRQHPSNLLAWLAAAESLRAGGHDVPRAERYLRRYLSQPPELGMPTHAQAKAAFERSGRSR